MPRAILQRIARPQQPDTLRLLLEREGGGGVSAWGLPLIGSAPSHLEALEDFAVAKFEEGERGHMDVKRDDSPARTITRLAEGVFSFGLLEHKRREVFLDIEGARVRLTLRKISDHDVWIAQVEGGEFTPRVLSASAISKGLKAIPGQSALPHWHTVEASAPAVVVKAAPVDPMGTVLRKAEAGDEAERYVAAVVMTPGEHTAEDIQHAAWDYLATSRTLKVGDRLLTEEEATVVESGVAPAELTLNGETIPEGAWFLGLVVHDDEIWKAIEAGEIAGLVPGVET